MGLALLFWSPLRARLHIVPKPWTRTGRTARSALLAPFSPANGGDHVGGYDRKQLAATGGVAGPSMAPMRKPTREMRNAMIASLAVFMASVWLLQPALGNHGLWLALMIFMVARAIFLGLYYPRIERAVAAPAT